MPLRPGSLEACSAADGGTTSEYTRFSRTLLAMSWVYCDPKSTMRTRSCKVLPAKPVVGRLLGDADVVGMVFTPAGVSDAEETSLGP